MRQLGGVGRLLVPEGPGHASEQQRQDDARIASGPSQHRGGGRLGGGRQRLGSLARQLGGRRVSVSSCWCPYRRRAPETRSARLSRLSIVNACRSAYDKVPEGKSVKLFNHSILKPNSFRRIQSEKRNAAPQTGSKANVPPAQPGIIESTYTSTLSPYSRILVIL
jgi:hypothetical protein